LRRIHRASSSYVDLDAHGLTRQRSKKLFEILSVGGQLFVTWLPLWLSWKLLVLPKLSCLASSRSRLRAESCVLARCYSED
jgi:hypothetical protein